MGYAAGIMHWAGTVFRQVILGAAGSRGGDMDADRLLQDIKEALRSVHGERLRGVVLYGSEARGAATEDSDIDVLVLLRGPIELGRDIRANIDALYPLVLEVGRPIHAQPVDVQAYEAGLFPLFRRAKREGIPA